MGGWLPLHVGGSHGGTKVRLQKEEVHSPTRRCASNFQPIVLVTNKLAIQLKIFSGTKYFTVLNTCLLPSLPHATTPITPVFTSSVLSQSFNPFNLMAVFSRVCGWRDSGDNDIRCDCLQYVARPDQNPNTAIRCRDCGHYKTWHDAEWEETETEVVKSIMNQCNEELGTVVKTRATKGEATVVKTKVTTAVATSEALGGLRKDLERTKASVCHLMSSS
jgi:hypothetical protein